jgi:hypothetical protein
MTNLDCQLVKFILAQQYHSTAYVTALILFWLRNVFSSWVGIP